jgi:hypothetical protein
MRNGRCGAEPMMPEVLDLRTTGLYVDEGQG